FEQWTSNVGNAELVLLQNATRFLDFLRIKTQEIFVPHATELDPVHAEFSRDHCAGVIKILADFVVDDRDAEWSVHTRIRSFSSMFFLLIWAASFGLPGLSATLSSATTAQPRNFTLSIALKTAGRSTCPRPSSTKRYELRASAAFGSRSTSFI